MQRVHNAKPILAQVLTRGRWFVGVRICLIRSKSWGECLCWTSWFVFECRAKMWQCTYVLQ